MAKQINSQSLWIFIVSGIGLIVAFYAGNSLVDENYSLIGYVLGGMVGILLFFSIGQSANLLIPICYGLTGQITMLPLPFSVQQLAVILACGVFISGIIFNKSHRKIEIEKIDLIAWINIVWLFGVYIRNPTGIQSLGTSLVGGKPYVDFVLAVMSYIILSRQIISPRQASIIVTSTVVLSLVISTICLLVLFFPSVGNFLGQFYSGFIPWGVEEGSEVSVGETRLNAFQGSGLTLIIYCVCRINPMTMLAPKNWKFFVIYVIGTVMVLLSGFRSSLFAIILLTGLGTYLREKFVGVNKLIFALFFTSVMFILVSYSGFQLPLTFQRALSFLPGNWDQTAVQLAQESTEWRHEMWETVMTSDRYIRNKWLGDGYGFLRSDLEDMMDAANGVGRLVGVEGDKEAHMIQGTYHSGPISSIKRVGYLGLVILIYFMIALALYAWKLIHETEGTPFYLLALFIGMQMITLPLMFVFVFGDYNDILIMLFSLGMFKMILSSFNAYRDSMHVSSSDR